MCEVEVLAVSTVSQLHLQKVLRVTRDTETDRRDTDHLLPGRIALFSRIQKLKRLQSRGSAPMQGGIFFPHTVKHTWYCVNYN